MHAFTKRCKGLLREGSRCDDSVYRNTNDAKNPKITVADGKLKVKDIVIFTDCTWGDFVTRWLAQKQRQQAWQRWKSSTPPTRTSIPAARPLVTLSRSLIGSNCLAFRIKAKTATNSSSITISALAMSASNPNLLTSRRGRLTTRLRTITVTRSTLCCVQPTPVSRGKRCTCISRELPKFATGLELHLSMTFHPRRLTRWKPKRLTLRLKVLTSSFRLSR
ncbi:major tail protein [Klebsiella phage vB_KshKPC-M]|nr:major tail protein [Klebsiella phage vB_KshKPC-M]